MGSDAHLAATGDGARIVARRRLEDAFQAAAVAPLTLVTAPAGYGKTIAARSFQAACNDPVAYVAYDPGDDRASAWNRIRNAVDGAHAAPWVRATIDVLGRRDYTNLDRVGEVFDAAPGSRQRLVVVLDGLDRVGDQRLVEEVAIFVNRLPDDLCLVALTERKLPWPTARWRVQGRLADIGPEELRFDDDEAAAFFASHQGVAPPSERVAALNHRAEGWPLGLLLLARHVGPEDEDPDAPLDPEQPAAAAVVAKVLDPQPPEVQDFLLETAVLSRFDADLCRAVTGREDAGGLLRRVEDANLFLFPVDDQPGWFRYCHLFAELMCTELDRRSPGRRPELHRRAAAWWRERGDMRRALRQLVAADRVEEAFELAKEGVYRPGRRSGLAGVDWEEIFPPAWIGEDASRMVQLAVLLGRDGAMDQAKKWIDRAEGAVGDVPVEDPRHATIVATQALWYGIHLDAATTIGYGESALEQLPQDDWAQPLVEQVLLTLANSHLALGQPRQAEQRLKELNAVARSAPLRDVVTPALSARVAVARGELRRAEEIARRTMRVAMSMQLDEHTAVHDARRALADVLTERGEPDDALVHVEAAAQSVEDRGWPVIAADVRLGRVRALAVRDGPVAALTALDEVRASLVSAHSEHGLSVRLDLFEARLRLAAGELDAAAALTAGVPPCVERTLLAVRLAVVKGDVAGATALLADTSPPYRREQIVAALLAARVAALSGRSAERDEALLDAARLGWPDGYVTVYLDEAPELVRRLGELVERDPRLRDIPSQPVQLVTSAPLTEREREVLRYLRGDLTNPEIAGELGISENTLKSHVRGLYRKLGVTSRSEAIATARRAGLL